MILFEGASKRNLTMSLIVSDQILTQCVNVRRAAPPRCQKFASAITVARYALVSPVLPLAQAALPFAEQVRRALINRRVDTSHSEAITGKTVDGTSLEGHEHAHYFATDEDGDGRLDHVTIYAPCGFRAEDVDALGAMKTISRRGNRPDVRMVLTGLGNLEQFQSQISVFALSTRWRSVTPFSLPRFASRGAGKPPRPHLG
jgi:CRISPR-associated protein Csb2